MNCACRRVNWPDGMNCPAGHQGAIQITERSEKSWRSQIMTAKPSIHKEGFTMSDNQLVMLSKFFAVSIINLCETMRERKKASAIINQLLRSGTSIGANIHEANYASSKADFINKFQIALKECYETDYWLEIFHNSKMISDEEYSNMFSQCSKIRKLLIASITTAKKNAAQQTKP